MSSVCISTCLKDARLPVVRATYVNLYKWPESDAEFVRSVSSNSRARGSGVCGCPPRVVDSISCRQMYLRSYPFSREEDHRRPQSDVTRCFGRARGRARKEEEGTRGDKRREGRGRGRRGKRCAGLRRVKEVSWGALFRIFHGLLSCSASVDVVD
ncbi:hypothetical protein MLD38_026491 [Melastoma candidum]|uniref:Uncharacterized protein n=1 Tax=Melastoma candidum TaxID=119954 RepID=A0ACB9P0B5_9MYRT|nr:hypothetical protein MLD38_026491 [Melastoma candidum]